MEFVINTLLSPWSPIAPSIEPPLELHSIESYLSIREKVQSIYSNPSTLYVKSELDLERHERPLLRVLGEGGSKQALDLSGGKALLLPNMSVDGVNGIYSRWPRVVKEEVQMSRFIQNIGLLGTQLQEVKVFSTSDTAEYTPAYTTDTFESLKARNIYVIDGKNIHSCTWTDDCKLFPSREDTKNAENWQPLVKELVQDCAKLAYHHLPVVGDSFNAAVIREVDGDQIRYFGFDYSHKHKELQMPTESYPAHLSTNELLAKTSTAFGTALEHVLFQEYDATFCLPKEAYDTIDSMKQAFQDDMLKEIRTLQQTSRRFL